MKPSSKITLGAVFGLMMFIASVVLGQDNFPPSPPQASEQFNILSAAFHQVLNNPASLTVIPFLCVIAWLMDDLPFINSRYVAHLTVIMGASIYGLFAGPASVAKAFPYPFMVFISNGTLCGFVAFVVHRQAVARLINWVRRGSPYDGANPDPRHLNPPSPDTTLLIKPQPPTKDNP